MKFKKYQHVERFGTPNVRDIEIGECYVFAKIDGINSSCYLDDYGNIKAGSRNREVTLENDNQGFYARILENEKIKAYLEKYPNHRLFGEYLVRHTVQTYRDDAWKRFYIFDVVIDSGEDDMEYIPYDIYKEYLDEFELDYIPPIAKIINPTYENLIRCLEKNKFLIKDGEDDAEGIVIKNYSYKNTHNKTIWAKIVSNEFKEKHCKKMGVDEIKPRDMVEEKIIDDFVTTAFIEKEYAKIIHEQGDWTPKLIPMLLNKIYYELVTEEIWNIVKKYKNPKIDFRTLNSLVTAKIKQVKRDIF